MKILAAPCSFKESLTATDAARCIAQAAGALDHIVEELPLADGGEGTLDALHRSRGLELHTADVPGPLGMSVRARWGLHGKEAVLEAAEAVGLTLLDHGQRDPMRAETRGLGLLVREALDAGATQLLIGLGGTATVDGGAGMLASLGARFLDDRGRALDPMPVELERLARVDLGGIDPRLAGTEITGLVDVDVPLLGADGARLFMRQKGATDDMKVRLEAVLARLHREDVASMPGAGAAGGLGAAILSLGGSLRSGAAFLLESLDVEQRIAAADLVMTGEGRIDAQTVHGKLVAALAMLCRRHGRPLVAFCGGTDGDLSSLHQAGVSRVVVITPTGQGRSEALACARENLARAVTAELLTLSARLGGP